MEKYFMMRYIKEIILGTYFVAKITNQHYSLHIIREVFFFFLVYIYRTDAEAEAPIF